MPLYQVEHICHLSDAQEDTLAEAITKFHTEQFTTPSLFVNVAFTNVSSQRTYVAGKRKSSNRIIAHVRHGPSRTQRHYDTLCSSIQEAWRSIVEMPSPSPSKPLVDSSPTPTNRPDSTAHLRTILVLGDIVAGQEAGMAMPQAGHDKQWLRNRLYEIEDRAEDGNEDFQELIAEVKERVDLSDVASYWKSRGH